MIMDQTKQHIIKTVRDYLDGRGGGVQYLDDSVMRLDCDDDLFQLYLDDDLLISTDNRLLFLMEIEDMFALNDEKKSWRRVFDYAV